MFDTKTAIGAIHFSPMVGFDGFTSYEDVLSKALLDLEALKEIDMIIVENNYDLPHKINISNETYSMMKNLIFEIKKHTSQKIGISILWNDYRNALKMAKETGCDFIRIPVFVDHVETDFGTIRGNPIDVIDYRSQIDAKNVRILTDIQVKHSKILNPRPIKEAALEAIEKGSDGLIITGKWTGDAPDFEELKQVKSVAGDFPILLGSGVDKSNIKELLEYCTGVIISTSLKEGNEDSKERNIKPYQSRIDVEKVKNFMKSFRGK